MMKQQIGIVWEKGKSFCKKGIRTCDDVSGNSTLATRPSSHVSRLWRRAYGSEHEGERTSLILLLLLLLLIIQLGPNSKFGDLIAKWEHMTEVVSKFQLDWTTLKGKKECHKK